MAEPTTFQEGFPSGKPAAAFPAEHIAPPVMYRRISGFAISSFAVAAFFALFLIISIAWGFRDQAPVLLPVYVQVVPVIAIALGLTALVFIRSSEETLAGRRLANWGLGLGAVGALGYWAYYIATAFAISAQAETFTREWFDKILTGKMGAAFLDTQDPAARQKVNPEDLKTIHMRFLMALPSPKGGPQRGPLATFRENDMVRTLIQGGDKTQIKPKGVKEWEYKSGGYRVKQVFQVSTDDGIFDFQVTVHGIESRTHEFEGRAWYVVYTESAVVAQKVSALGENVKALRKESAIFINNWGEKLALGYLGLAHADTLEPPERVRLETEVGARLLIFPLSASNGSGFSAAINLEAVREWHRMENSRSSRLLRQRLAYGHSELQSDDDATKKDVLAGIEKMLGSPERGPILLKLFGTNDSLRRPWRYKDQRLQLPHDCKLGFFMPPNHQYEVDATVTVESEPGSIEAGWKPRWRIVGLELFDAQDRSKLGQGPGGMPNMPRGMQPPGPGGMPDPGFAQPPPLR